MRNIQTGFEHPATPFLQRTVLVAEFGGGQFQELIEAYSSGLVFIEFSQDLVDELVLSSEAEADERLFELLRVNHAAAVAVKDFEGEFDVLDLFEWDGERDVVFGIEAFLFGLFRLLL